MAYQFGIKPRTMYYWYKHYFSGYYEKIKAGTWGGKTIKIVDKATGEIAKEKPVPIAKAENMDTHMTIDEKMIGKKMYTVMTNLNTGKLAFIAQSQNGEELKPAIKEYFADRLDKVTSISCDMNATYKKISRELFPNAHIVVDKFHVIAHIMDALQQVRKSVKNSLINDDKEESQLSAAPIEGLSELEYIERARYILYKKTVAWDKEEQSVMLYLFSRYPALEKAHRLTEKIRAWYDKKHIGRETDFIERDLYDWFDDVVASKLSAFRPVRKMMEKHFDGIINYFKEGHTNAKAENMNGKIQRFLTNNFGIRDRDFFFFRLAGYFA